MYPGGMTGGYNPYSPFPGVGGGINGAGMFNPNNPYVGGNYGAWASAGGNPALNAGRAQQSQYDLMIAQQQLAETQQRLQMAQQSYNSMSGGYGSYPSGMGMGFYGGLYGGYRM